MEVHAKDRELFDSLGSSALQVEKKCALLVDMVKQTAQECREERRPRAEDNALKDQINALLAERKSMQGRTSEERKKLSKEIQRQIRKDTRLKQREQISRIISDFVGFKRISNIKNNEKKEALPKMVDKCGVPHDSRQEIADVFAEFYADLFAARNGTGGTGWADGGWPAVPAFTEAEVRDALKRMKCGKAADKSGLVAELLKDGGAVILKAISIVFNDILVRDLMPPREWKESRIIVLFKKGDKHKPEKYRPIT